MSIRLSRFEMPKRVIKEEAGATTTYCRFVAEPFEVGYARTLGNSLRRVLLSSIEGVAITSVRIKGAEHEFCSLPGVQEDVTDIILNLKQVLLKSYLREPRWLSLHRKGPCTVTAADFETDNSIEVLNPAQPIATLAVDGELDMEIEVCTGRGFFPAEWNKSDDQEIGRIAIDSIFSPVTRVNFVAENTRVGQRTDYEKLIIDIWTDGRVDPDDALKTAASILRHHLDVFVDYSEEIVEFEEAERKVDEERERLRRILNMSVNEIELSVRAANCLNNANITTVGELASKSEADMLKYRNFGKKSLNEIKEKLSQLGLGLDYKFDPELLEPHDEEPSYEVSEQTLT
ncbi:MAG: DNA-directed RNA polymerase subunit alpha [Lentisphaerae bacterium]|nr:DNA-directed RNA polymerase subunit alpha [Lentisphaerota bacterium]